MSGIHAGSSGRQYGFRGASLKRPFQSCLVTTVHIVFYQISLLTRPFEAGLPTGMKQKQEKSSRQDARRGTMRPIQNVISSHCSNGQEDIFASLLFHLLSGKRENHGNCRTTSDGLPEVFLVAPERNPPLHNFGEIGFFLFIC